MSQKKYGLFPVRKCTLQEETLIKSKYAEVQPILQQHRSQVVYWVNTYLDGEFCWQPRQKEIEFHEWVQKLILQVQNGQPQYIMVYGFINNPKQNRRHQALHLDYNPEVKTIFIPLTYFIHENATQFLDYEPPCQPMVNERGAAERFAFTEIQLLERSNRDFLTISQVICKPFVILRLEPGTCHRGTANSGTYDRPMFGVNYCKKKVETYYQGKVDKWQ